jgi:hypothetical protein
MRRLSALGLCASLWCASTAAGDSGEGWRVVAEERGITVSVRDEPGRELPTFRGQGVIEGDVLTVLAVVLDVPAAMEWAEGATETRVVKEVDPRTTLIYTRTDTPWPVSDRDMYMQRKTEVVHAGEEFKLRIECMSGEKLRDGVVRVTDCESSFTLRKVDATHTRIDYQVNLDPGGNLPKFLIKWASKKVPFDTLVNLEAYAKEKHDKYKKDVVTWASAQ